MWMGKDSSRRIKSALNFGLFSVSLWSGEIYSRLNCGELLLKSPAEGHDVFLKK